MSYPLKEDITNILIKLITKYDIADHAPFVC